MSAESASASLLGAGQGETSATSGVQQFEDRSFDATNYIQSACACFWSLGIVGWTTKRLTLDNDEAILTTKNFCVNAVQKRPYAQLGAVDKENVCLCCYQVKTDLDGANGEGLSRGWGCDSEWVSEVTSELQARKVGRGNIAQLKAQEVLATRVDHLHAKLDIILEHLRLSPPPPPALGVAAPAVGVAAPSSDKVVRD